MNKLRVAFIGSRTLHRNNHIADQKLCYQVCYRFAELGFTFTSGLCAEGMDTIVQEAYSDALQKNAAWQSQFEVYVATKQDIDKSRLPNRQFSQICNPQFKMQAEKIAESLHPVWQNCNHYARRQLTRNVHIILGHNLDKPVDAVITWCELDNFGNWKGGTGLALRLAKSRNIPIFNLNTLDKKAVLRDIKQWLNWNEVV